MAGRRHFLAMRTRKTLRPPELHRRLAHDIFNAWARGRDYAALAQANNMTVDEARSVISGHVQQLWKAHAKWKLAETRCHALGIELRLLRLGKECPEDQPIETLNPPACWLDAYQRAGIETVNQLRAVHADVLLARWRFPAGAIDWAVMKLDKLGLSHALVRPKHVGIPRMTQKIVR